MNDDLKLEDARPWKSALSDFIAGDSNRMIDPLWEEAGIAWYEGGHEDEARTDRAKARSMGDWLSSWVEAELRKKAEEETPAARPSI